MNLLPQEVLDQIIDNLSSDRPALKNCTLTARRWLPRSSIYLFASCVSPVLRGSDQCAQITLATCCTQRISTNIVILGLYITSPEDIEFVGLLPQLQELCIRSVDGEDALAQAYAALTPGRRTAQRSIALVNVWNAPLFVLEWVLQQFTAVTAVHFQHATGRDGHMTALRARHVVRHLEMGGMALAALRAMGDILDTLALLSLTIGVGYRYHAHGDVDAFIRTTGRYIRNFQVCRPYNAEPWFYCASST